MKLQYLSLVLPQFDARCRRERTSFLQLALVRSPPSIEQFLDTVAPDRCNDPELGKMGPDCIDHRGLLTDEQMARTVQHQATLLF